MTRPSRPPAEPAPGRLTLLRRRQTEDWRAGRPRPAEDYLAAEEGLSEEDALVIVAGELLLRWGRGERPDLADYQRRFPHLAADLADQFDLAAGLADTYRAGPPPPGHGAPAVPGFEIQAEVGRGAFGVVYRAVQAGLGRTVALKMLREGAPGDHDQLARFRREAETVARLRHPNVVAVYEVGEAAGRAYFALEYAEGGSLAERLAGTTLPAREAAGLIEALSRAVEAAHRCGVVHRDLKPGNVLLQLREGSGAAGAPAQLPLSAFVAKVADFGLARRLDLPSGATATGHVLGTPSYMAPEQAEGKKDVGPPADVYALGAVLYECLTGRPPFKAESVLEVLLQVRTMEPIPPRRLQPKVPRDLETICLKCLQKDPARRYTSAAALADDLRRYLDGRPIVARPIGPAGRLARWCRRRPAVAGLLAASLLLLAGGVGGVVWQWRRAERHLAEANEQRDRATENFRLARQAVRDYCVRVSIDQRLRQSDLTELRKDLLQTAARFHERFRELESDDPDVQAERAEALFELAFINKHVGSTGEAREYYAESLALWEALAAAHPGIRTYKLGLADCLNDMAEPGKDEEALYLRAISLLQELTDTGGRDPVVPGKLAQSQNNLALWYVNNRRFKEAEEWYGKALAGLRARVADHPANWRLQRLLAGSRHHLAYVYYRTNRYPRAEEGMLEALALREELVRERRGDAGLLEDLVWSRKNLGDLYRDMGKAVEAGRSFAGAAVGARQLADAHGSVIRYQHTLTEMLNAQALFYQANGQPEQAAKAARQCIEIQERLVKQFPEDVAHAVGLGGSYCNFGRRLAQNGDPQAALEWFDKARAQLEQVYKQAPKRPYVRTYLCYTHWNRGHALLALSRPADAVEQYDRAVELANQDDLDSFRLGRAVALARLGKVEEAVALAGKLSEPAGAGYYPLFHAARVLAAASKATTQEKPAREYADRAVGLLRRLQAKGHFKKAENVLDLKRDQDLRALGASPEYQMFLAELDKR